MKLTYLNLRSRYLPVGVLKLVLQVCVGNLRLCQLHLGGFAFTLKLRYFMLEVLNLSL